MEHKDVLKNMGCGKNLEGIFQMVAMELNLG